MGFISDVIDRANELALEKYSSSIYKLSGLEEDESQMIKHIIAGPDMSSILSLGAMSFLKILAFPALLPVEIIKSVGKSTLRQLYSNSSLYVAAKRIQNRYEASGNIEDAANELLESIVCDS